MVTLGRMSIKLGFRDDREVFVRKALIQGRHGQGNGIVTGHEFFKRIAIGDLKAVALEQLRHRFSSTHGRGAHQDAMLGEAFVIQEVLELKCRVIGLAIDLYVKSKRDLTCFELETYETLQ